MPNAHEIFEQFVTETVQQGYAAYRKEDEHPTVFQTKHGIFWAKSSPPVVKRILEIAAKYNLHHSILSLTTSKSALLNVKLWSNDGKLIDKSIITISEWLKKQGS